MVKSKRKQAAQTASRARWYTQEGKRMLIDGVTKLELCMKQAKLLWYKKQLQLKQLQLKQL